MWLYCGWKILARGLSPNRYVVQTNEEETNEEIMIHHPPFENITH